MFSYTFDELNRETRKNYPAPAPVTGDDIQSIVTVYDANGNAIRVTETYSGATGTRVSNKSYDNFDRLIENTDAFNKTIKYQYDANGNRTVLTDPDAKTTRYGYDALNRVTSVTNAGGTTTYDYDRSSLPTKTTFPNGTTATTTYDAGQRVATITNRMGASTVSSYQYTYDRNGNRATQIEANGAAGQTTTYTYDTNDRLTGVAYPDKSTTFTYDGAYNRLTERTVLPNSTVQVDRSYTYDVRNQLTVITDHVNAAESVAYDYDANGNQTIKTKNGLTTTFVYDVRDQLISVRQDATTLGLFRYDYQGLRVSKDMGGQIVRYTYDDDSVLLQSDNAGATIAKYDYGSDRLLSLTSTSEGRQFYLFDALGSVANLTNSSGTIQARYQYDAFGNIRSEAGSSYNRFTFTGHERDTETGLYYFKARFYDPDTARFLSQDPYLGDANTPPSLHRYLYAYANPTVYVDLDGYESLSTMIDNGAESCGTVSCAGWALLKGAYIVGTLGFASVHDPVKDAYDEGKISGKQYAVGLVGGTVVAGVNVAATVMTAGTGTAATAAATTTLMSRLVSAAATGGAVGLANDSVTQATHVNAGIQEGYDPVQAAKSTAIGAAFGAGSAAIVEGAVAAQTALKARAAAREQPQVVGESQAGGAAPTANFETQRPTSQLADTSTTPAKVQAPPVPEGVPAPAAGQGGTTVGIAKRPGGYKTHDVDEHGLLKRQDSRASGHANSPADGQVQSHHPIQREWAKRNIEDYSENQAPAVLLKSVSGSQHAKISAAQRAWRRQLAKEGRDPYTTTIDEEFNAAYRQMRDAGVPEDVVRKAIKDTYKYLDELGAFK